MLRKFASVVVALGLLTACSPGTSAPVTEAKRMELDASRLKDYQSISELKAASTAVVRVTVEAAAIEQMNGIPLTVSTVRVRKLYWGEVSASSLLIQQVGEASMILDDTGSILAKDRDYVLFITPFHLAPGDSTSRYVITGCQGVFAFEGRSNKFVFAGGGKPLHLPKELKAADVDSGSFLG